MCTDQRIPIYESPLQREYACLVLLPRLHAMLVPEQIERLVALGVPELAGLTSDDFRRLGANLPADGVVVVGPGLVTPRLLAPLLESSGKPGFVVEDLTDLDDFADQVEVPAAGLYLIRGVDRGDELRNWSPNEALPELESRGRSPMTLSEGISWLLQEPDRLERDACFMCIGTRKPKGKGLDARTPAIWLSNGTGRDGTSRRNAPKVGWCWAGNRHTWLGIASVQSRIG